MKQRSTYQGSAQLICRLAISRVELCCETRERFDARRLERGIRFVALVLEQRQLARFDVGHRGFLNFFLAFTRCFLIVLFVCLFVCVNKNKTNTRDETHNKTNEP